MREKRNSFIISILCIAFLIIGLLPTTVINTNASSLYSFTGEAHVQTYGDKAGVYKNNTLTLGTTGQSKRLERVKINFINNTGYNGSIEYRVHRQTYGWTNWVGNGQYAGTKGEGKRLEGIQIRLTGEIANHYSIRYRVHIQTYGWNQGWQYDGALAGTEGEAKRLESLEVQLVPKSESMNVAYRVHRQTYGWETSYASNGKTSGTTGQAKRLEGIEIALTGNAYSGSIIYSTHVQSYGWLNEVSNGMMSGTTGKAKRLEAIKIRLAGEVSNYYDVYYRVHAQSYGWLGWAKNGEVAGTSGLSKRLEAIQILLVKKNGNAPETVDGIPCTTSTAYVTSGTSLSPYNPDSNSSTSGNSNTSKPSNSNNNASSDKPSGVCNHEFEKVWEYYHLDAEYYMETHDFHRCGVDFIALGENADIHESHCDYGGGIYEKDVKVHQKKSAMDMKSWFGDMKCKKCGYTYGNGSNYEEQVIKTYDEDDSVNCMCKYCIESRKTGNWDTNNRYVTN